MEHIKKYRGVFLAPLMDKEISKIEFFTDMGLQSERLLVSDDGIEYFEICSNKECCIYVPSERELEIWKGLNKLDILVQKYLDRLQRIRNFS